jgi:hypothetical protein
VDAGSREENASKQESRASVLIQSEPKTLKSNQLFVAALPSSAIRGLRFFPNRANMARNVPTWRGQQRQLE